MDAPIVRPAHRQLCELEVSFVGFLSSGAPLPSQNSEVDMRAEARDNNRPAIAVKAGIVDERDLSREVQAADNVGGVVRLARALSPISKRTIA